MIKESFSLRNSRFSVLSSRTKVCYHRNFQLFEIQVSVQQLLRIGSLFVKGGPENRTSSFVLSSESLSFFSVIESVLPKFIEAIMYFRP